MLNRQPIAKISETSSLASSLMVLFKVRIVLLLVLAALGGMFLGAGGWPGVGPLLLISTTGALTAMGSSAWNQYLERESDALMNRTRRRPLVTGAIARPNWVPYAATAMIAAPVAAVLPTNPALAFFLIAGAFIYVVVYTIWLKPRTNLNIVIGGAAGSAAVLSGGAAVGAWNHPGVVGLAALLFFWTPIHFWALALVYKEDYARASVPMLPVTTTPRWAAFWALLHGIGAGVAGIGLAFVPGLGLVYGAPVAIATAALLWQGATLVVDPTKRRAYRLFHTSNLFLTLVLVAIIVAAVVRR